MRELHVVGLSSDGKHVVLTATKGSLRGAYLLAVSPRLTKALAGELNGKGPAKARAKAKVKEVEPEPETETARATPERPPAESKLTPKDIQARLRSGHTPERVARAAGVPVDRVTRFYGPVLSERAQVVSAAQDATLARARLGESAAPLGESVAANLAGKGAPLPAAEAWTAFRRPDGSWTVRLDLLVRGRSRRADWSWNPASRTLVAADTYAAELGHTDAATIRRYRAARRARPGRS